MSAVIGIDMGGTRIKTGLVENNRLVAASKMMVTSHSLKDNLNSLKGEIFALLAKTKGSLTGVGIAFPSIVDSRNMKILSRYVKYTDAQDIDLSAWARNEFGVPLAIENDARAALIGEWQYGAGKNCDNLVLLTLGTGVGSAVLLEGRLLKGKHFFAGNLGGHMTINFDGKICNCGNIGCVETEGSTWALPQRVMELSQRNPDFTLLTENEFNFEAIFNKAKFGEKLARALKENCLKAWSLCVINLIHAYDPEKIIIGGGIMKSKEEILPVIRNMVNKHSWNKTGDIEIIPAQQVEYAGIFGMSHLVQELTNK